MIDLFYCLTNSGRYVTLYMNPDTMTVAETMFIPSVTSAIGKLCPNMRRVPQIVSAVPLPTPIQSDT